MACQRITSFSDYGLGATLVIPGFPSPSLLCSFSVSLNFSDLLVFLCWEFWCFFHHPALA